MRQKRGNARGTTEERGGRETTEERGWKGGLKKGMEGGQGRQLEKGGRETTGDGVEGRQLKRGGKRETKKREWKGDN